MGKRGFTYLKSRLGQEPHAQYTNIMDLVQGRAPTTDSSSQPKSLDILALYNAFRNSDDNNNNAGNLTFIPNNLFINNVPDDSENNSDDSIIDNFAVNQNPRPPVTSVVPEPTVVIPESLASDDLPSLHLCHQFLPFPSLNQVLQHSKGRWKKYCLCRRSPSSFRLSSTMMLPKTCLLSRPSLI